MRTCHPCRRRRDCGCGARWATHWRPRELVGRGRNFWSAEPLPTPCTRCCRSQTASERQRPRRPRKRTTRRAPRPSSRSCTIRRRTWRSRRSVRQRRRGRTLTEAALARASDPKASVAPSVAATRPSTSRRRPMAQRRPCRPRGCSLPMRRRLTKPLLARQSLRLQRRSVAPPPSRTGWWQQLLSPKGGLSPLIRRPSLTPWRRYERLSRLPQFPHSG
mmetsp:Transcript_22535/g.69676  ORF Transcript_22535/g.69676 Transcript_22535/m.69676 type:complete len:218 (+) Transcript_22535:431-1084(+)